MKEPRIIRLCMITKKDGGDLKERLRSRMMMLFLHSGVKIAMRSLYNAAENDAELRKRRIAEAVGQTRYEQEGN